MCWGWTTKLPFGVSNWLTSLAGGRKTVPQTALNRPTAGMSDYERDVVAKVRKYGWFQLRVVGDEKSPLSFSYTTGFWRTLGAPEILLFSLPEQTAHNVLWDVFRYLKSGQRPQAGVPVSGIFGNANAVFLPVARRNYQTYMRTTRWFYGHEDFPCFQLFWPDRQGRFPWEAEFEVEFRKDQPDLTARGWSAEIPKPNSELS